MEINKYNDELKYNIHSIIKDRMEGGERLNRRGEF